MSCKDKEAQIAKNESEIHRLGDLLGANRMYLTKIDPNQVSKVIKIDSNIKVILVRLNELNANVSQMKTEMKKEGCEKCQKQT